MSNAVDRLHVTQLSASSFTPPASCITNAAIVDSAGIDAAKVVHQFSLDYTQAPGSDVVAATQDLHIAQAAGTVEAVEAVLTGQIPSVDRTAVIDVQKSTAGGAFASVLTATLTLNSSNTIRVPVDATVNTSAYADADILRIVVTLGGSSGTHPQGLLVTVTVTENPAP